MSEVSRGSWNINTDPKIMKAVEQGVNTVGAIERWKFGDRRAGSVLYGMLDWRSMSIMKRGSIEVPVVSTSIILYNPDGSIKRSASGDPISATWQSGIPISLMIEALEEDTNQGESVRTHNRKIAETLQQNSGPNISTPPYLKEYVTRFVARTLHHRTGVQDPELNWRTAEQFLDPRVPVITIPKSPTTPNNKEYLPEPPY